jgi:PHD/YefM family antitoxin component YafN of YafNO toxin-antitoxin module
MAIPLSEEQQRAIDSAIDTPPRVVDPRTRASYVLVPVEDYEAVREALLDERQQKAIRHAAMTS